jgi:hypothetical protein
VAEEEESRKCKVCGAYATCRVTYSSQTSGKPESSSALEEFYCTRHFPDVRRTGTIWFLLTILFAAVNIVAANRISSSVDYFYEGQKNSDPSFIFPPVDLIMLASWGATTIALLCVSFVTRGAVRTLARGGLLVCLIVLPFQCDNRMYPLELYENGFVEWTSSHLTADDFQHWYDSLPAVPKQAEIAPAGWPAFVTSLSPSHVFQLPNHKGLILQWGELGAWGDSRRVFVAANDEIAPPDTDENVLFHWRNICPSIFAAYQQTD